MIDPAVHIMGWSRERVRKHLEHVGQTREEADGARRRSVNLPSVGPLAA
jgi:hypothetical protein